MDNLDYLNLDYLAAKYAQAIIADSKIQKIEKSSEIENAVTKTLGVLQECGVYACFVFALSRTNGKDEKNEVIIFNVIIKQQLELLSGLDLGTVSEATPERLKYIADITKDLQKTLLAKEVLEQMLIYARYGAKAREDKKS